MRRALLVLALVVAAPACALGRALERPTVPPAPRACQDNLPPLVLRHASCRHGICGYTCEPGRWDRPPSLVAAAMGAAGVGR